MFNDFVRKKFGNIFRFFFASLKVMLSSVVLGLGALIAFAIAGSLASGDWTIGTSFETWWASMNGSEVIDGKFSAVDFNTCWSCSLFAKCFDLMSLMGLKLYIYIADIAWTLIIMGFAVWLLMYMYDNLIKDQKSDVSSMLRDIAKKVIVIGVIGVALFSTTDKNKNEQYITNMANTIFENTAVPILKMGIGIGTETLKVNVCDKLYYPKSEVGGIITEELKNDMLCLMNSVNTVFLSSMTAGSNMIGMSWRNFMENPIGNAKYLPDIVAGMAIVAIFFLMYLTIPFMLIDIVFTMGILISFIPLMIGGYAYDRTKSFSSKGISSLFGMSFYIIMYSIFLGILYSSFVYIADMYYPGPIDNFTYLFPDFIYTDMVSSQTANIMKNEGFRACFNSAGGNVSQIQTCLARIGIDFKIPSISNPGGSFLPMFTFGLLSLMIMGNVKTYSKLISGYMFEVGKYGKSLLTSFWKWTTSTVKREQYKFLEDKKIKKLMDEELAKDENKTKNEAKDIS